MDPLTKLRRGLTRDQQIVICYKAGNTISTIASAFELTKQRVHQILKKNDCTRKDNPRTRSKQLYAFIGANVPAELKTLIEKTVKKKRTSISAYITRLIKDDLDIGDFGDSE